MDLSLLFSNLPYLLVGAFPEGPLGGAALSLVLAIASAIASAVLGVALGVAMALARGPGRVLLLDDLLATGGTAAAAAKLVRKVGAEIVEIGFLIELSFLSGREKLDGHPIHSVITY